MLRRACRQQLAVQGKGMEKLRVVLVVVLGGGGGEGGGLCNHQESVPSMSTCIPNEDNSGAS